MVADTGDFTSIKVFRPQDATTNPTLMYVAEYEGRTHSSLNATKLPACAKLMQVAVDRVKNGEQ